MGGWTGGRVDGRVGDYNATCVAPTDQLRLGLVEVSWSAGPDVAIGVCLEIKWQKLSQT